MFSLIEGSFENTCMCRFLYVYICTEGCFHMGKGWWLCLGMCLYIFIYIIYILCKSVIYALYIYIYIYIYLYIFSFSCDLVIQIISVSVSTTVKTFYRGHHQNLKIVPDIKTYPLHRGSFQIALFYFKNLLYDVRV